MPPNPLPPDPAAAWPQDLGTALRSRVAAVGAAGPPSGGLRVIHHKAGIRRRNRRIAAGGAAVAIFGVGLTLATSGVGLVPSLTGGGASAGAPAALGPSASASSEFGNSADGAGDRVVWPSIGSGKTGPAIGPLPPITSTPSAAAAANLPLCTAASLITTTTLGAAVNGVVYGHVDAVAQSSCVVVGPPVLAVANPAGDAASSVLILRENLTVAPLLPQVPTWGTTMVLHSGQGFEFQFAWAVAQCPTPTATATPSTSPAVASTTYTLGYAATGTTPSAVVTLTAQCGADVFVTDIYQPGAFPLPAVPSSPPPSASPSSAPPSSNPPPPPASTTAPPTDTTTPSSSPAGLAATSNSPSS